MFNALIAKLIQWVGQREFSSLPAQAQLKYIEKIISKAARGYLTMNGGNAQHKTKHLSLSELREYLPSFAIVEEGPLTMPGNYVIVWGHGRNLKALDSSADCLRVASHKSA